MIIKIEDQNMTGQVINTNDPPEGFEYFPAYKGAGHTMCFLADGMTGFVAVPFTVVEITDPVLETLPGLVDVAVLDAHGLPHGV